MARGVDQCAGRMPPSMGGLGCTLENSIVDMRHSAPAWGPGDVLASASAQAQFVGAGVRTRTLGPRTSRRSLSLVDRRGAVHRVTYGLSPWAAYAVLCAGLRADRA